MLSLDAVALAWQADDEGWRFSRRIGDVDIYQRPVEAPHFRHCWRMLESMPR